MNTYVTLYNWTQQGIENVKDSPARLDKAREMVESMGGRIVGFYMTQGRYDLVVITEAPDDETVARIALELGSQGGVRSETMRAYPEDEYRRIISELS